MLKSFTYVIVGGGMTAHAAYQGIREVDPHGTIAIFCRESWPPYQRPPLTKGLWNGDSVDDIWLPIEDDLTEMHVGESIASIDPETQRLRNSEQDEYGYGKLLLATGAHVRHLPFGQDDVLYYRDMSSYNTLRSWTGKGDVFLIVGGGFIGSEIAAALSTNNEQVVMMFPDAGIGGRTFPADLSHYLGDMYREHGVEVFDGVEVQGIVENAGRKNIQTNLSRSFEVDHVVAGIGVLPNDAIAEAAGLETGDGVHVDAFLRSSDAHIFAAGDVANFYSAVLDRRMRVEHEDNALTMGKQAGRNMALQQAGKDAETYTHIPMFYSDLFDLGYEAVGLIDARLETVSDWKEPYREGIVYYLEDAKVRGVLLWNVWEKVDEARALLAASGPFTVEGIKKEPPINF
ncbi:NAD(P)/FAD-dependent oxidoreductase [bacterium]|nr:NAD(P)/FAD-dependent oxidoreductase [bacterium]